MKTRPSKLLAVCGLLASLLAGGCSPRDPMARVEAVAPTAAPDENGWPGTLDSYVGYTGNPGAGCRVGELFPNFLLQDQCGRSTRFDQFLGHILVLDFSAGWCGPCREAASVSMRSWEDVQQLGHPSYFITMLSQDEFGGPPNVHGARDWAEEYGIEYPVVVDFADPITDNLQNVCGVSSFPVFLFLSPDGLIYERRDNVPSETEILALVEQGIEDYGPLLRQGEQHYGQDCENVQQDAP